MRTLCKHCEECETHTYTRIGNTGKKTEFTYCNGNKHIVESSDWYTQKDGYCYSTNRFWGKKRFLHTLFKYSTDILIDHHDGDILNNTLRNLRPVTPRCNSQNRHSKRTSMFPGVYKVGEKYRASITHNKKTVSLGTYTDELEAFHAYVNYCNQNELTINKEIQAYKVYEDWLNHKPEEAMA